MHILKSDPLEYMLYEEKSMGAVFVDAKNHMDLYTVFPYRDSVFIDNHFPNNHRPLPIDFTRYQENNKNNSFRYHFSIETF